MSDLGLFWSGVDADLELSAIGDLASDAGLDTAVLLSLFTDRRLEDNDTPPDGSDDRRGWWGDQFSAVDGDKIGSRLWLLSRAKQTQDTLDRAEEYAKEALQWLLDDSVSSRIDVQASWIARGTMELDVQIYRPTGQTFQKRYNYNWAAQAAQTS